MLNGGWTALNPIYWTDCTSKKNWPLAPVLPIFPLPQHTQYCIWRCKAQGCFRMTDDVCYWLIDKACSFRIRRQSILKLDFCFKETSELSESLWRTSTHRYVRIWLKIETPNYIISNIPLQATVSWWQDVHHCQEIMKWRGKHLQPGGLKTSIRLIYCCSPERLEAITI